MHPHSDPGPHAGKLVAFSEAMNVARQVPLQFVAGSAGANGAVAEVYPPTHRLPSPWPR